MCSDQHVASAIHRYRGLGGPIPGAKNQKGLELALYVIKLDADNREVIVGPKEALATRTVLIKEINWLGEDNFLDSKERTLAVRVRSTRSPKEAIIKPISETTATVELVMAEEGIAPGQACVFYDIEGTRIYGGGWITNN